ncbi:hypothetical protein FQA39_LY13055 [Lamprigera yunnana]|nr:hypothetical protein FQA39_LY13055 [Lamprigera yunnana]
MTDYSITVKDYKFFIYTNPLKHCPRTDGSCSIQYFNELQVWLVPPPKKLDSFDAFRNLFTSSLVRILTIPQYEPTIKTLDELANSNLSIIAGDIMFNTILNIESNTTLSKKIKNKVVLSNYNEIVKIIEDERGLQKVAIPMGGYNLEMFIRIHQRNLQHFVDETFLGRTNYIFISKETYIMPSLNEIIKILLESGLLQHHQNQYKNVLRNYTDIIEKENTAPSGNVVLSLDHLYPIFVFWGAGLILATNLFTSSLIRILTIPQYEPTIKTLDELANSDLSIITHNITFNTILNIESNTTLSKKIKNKVVLSNYNEIVKIIEDERGLQKVAIPTEGYNLEMFIRTYQRNLQHFLDESFLGQTNYIFISKETYIMPSLNEIIKILLESGLLQHHQNQYKNVLRNYTDIIEKENTAPSGNVVLSLDHLYPIFVFWGAGLILATVVFIIELLWYEIQQKCITN